MDSTNTPRKFIFNQCLATVAVTIGIFGLGTVLAWSSPALPDMAKEAGGRFQNVTTEEQSWIGSIATVSNSTLLHFNSFEIYLSHLILLSCPLAWSACQFSCCWFHCGTFGPKGIHDFDLVPFHNWLVSCGLCN